MIIMEPSFRTKKVATYLDKLQLVN